MSNVKEYQRFSRSQRLEHWVMVAAFALLALTGLPQKFAGEGWAEAMIRALGGIEFTRLIHHTAAIVLLLAGIFHFINLLYRVIVLRVRWTMFPQLQDVLDAFQALLYNAGLRKGEPEYDHFAWGEKFEYWALVWGTLIMAFTGFMLWNPIITSRFLSGEVIPAAKAAHGAEAILAVLAVLIWHFYNVHLKTFSKVMFTGKISEHELALEHRLEFERLAQEGAAPVPDPVQLRQRRRVFLPIAVVVALTLGFVVLLFTTAETTAVTTIRREGATVQVYVPETKTPTPQPTAGPVQATPVNVTPGTAPVAAILAIPANHAGRTVCTACHTTGLGGAPKSPPDHAGRLDAQCPDCHEMQSSAIALLTAVPATAASEPTSTLIAATPAAAASPTTASAAASPTVAATSPAVGAIPTLPADHTGRAVCLACHQNGLAGAPKDPVDHGGRTDGQCLACHKPQ
jgi:cytochrome b subunit of formate dehydrogenase/cytochrome c5